MKSNQRQTVKVINNHLQAFAKGDIDALISDFADDATFYKQDGILNGKAEIRRLFNGLLEAMPPGSDIEIKKQLIDGEIAYLYWSGESESVEIPFATDTFIIRDGKIVKQTFAAEIKHKS